MNKLDQPDFFDDYAALDALSKNKRVGSYPRLKRYVRRVKVAYDQYIAVKGDASAIAEVKIPKTTKAFLLGHYGSPPADIKYITEIRRRSDANTCPMCGSLHSGTLDHVLPKADHPAFTIFGLNLVPACKCNSLRSNALTGPNAGERILHPYFDEVLGERILSAHFEDLGPSPRISVKIVLDPASPHISAARFHYINVVKRTGIRNYLNTMWGKLMLRPNIISTDFRKNPSSRKNLIKILEAERERNDGLRGSKNNWDSVFLSGLLDPPVVDLETELWRTYGSKTYCQFHLAGVDMSHAIWLSKMGEVPR